MINTNVTMDQAKSQINNFWSYLDDLAENNPEEYQKFISEQLKKGVKDNTDSTKSLIRSLICQPYISLRYKLIKIKDRNNTLKELQIFDKQSIQEIPNVIFSYQFNSQAFSQKIIEEPKIYLNIIHSTEFELPTDENYNKLKNPEDDKSWKYLPAQFRFSGSKKSMSGKDIEFYDAIINSVIVNKLNNEELKKSILAYITQKFRLYLEEKYDLFLKNVKILKKNYKSLKFKPDDFIIKPKVNYSNQPKPNPISKNFYDIEENKIKIPNTSENFPNESTFYNLPKQKKGKTNNDKKNLIEEVVENKKTQIHMKKTIISENQMEINFNLSEFKEINIDDINLQISSDCIKLEIDNYEKNKDYDPIDMELGFKLESDKVNTARYSKTNKILKLILVKL